MEFTVFNDFRKRSGEPIPSSELKKNLNQGLTTQLTNWGLNKYDGEYLGYSDFNEFGIKKVFKYTRLKGISGVFAWGVCFDFIPTFSNTKRLKNHKSDKSTTLHLFEWPDGYMKSFEGGGRPTEIISHYSGECKNDIQTVFDNYKSKISTYFKETTSIEGALEIVMSQIKKGGAYNIHFPHPRYVYSFLLAKSGRKEQGLEIMHESFKNYIEKDNAWKLLYEEIEKKIKSC